MQLPFLQKKHYYSIFISIILLLCGFLLLFTFNNDNEKEGKALGTIVVTANMSGMQTQGIISNVNTPGYTYTFLELPQRYVESALGLGFNVYFERQEGTSWKSVVRIGPSNLKATSDGNYTYSVSSGGNIRFYLATNYTYNTNYYNVSLTAGGGYFMGK